jgi:phage gp36-like protein
VRGPPKGRALISMAYVTETDFLQYITSVELAQLTGDADGVDVDAGILADAINYAENLINGKCAARYSVPFVDTIPPLIKSIAIELAIVRMRRARNSYDESAKEDYKRNMDLLKEIASGEINLGLDADGEPSTDAAKPDNDIFTRGRIMGRAY